MNLPTVIKYILGKRFRVKRFLDAWIVRTVVEPEPNPDSRVSLSHECDVLGLNRIKVDWQLSDLVQKTMLRTQQIIDEDLRKSGLGQMYIDPALAAGGWPNPIEWVWHHMGTTRMSDHPKHGVVNTDCRLHEVSNLYVAGSSVYPTGSRNAPTLTLVALALRLADHLKMRLCNQHQAKTTQNHWNSLDNNQSGHTRREQKNAQPIA